MNMLRAYLGGGMADLHAVHDWNKGFVRTSPAGERYEAIAREIDRALAFIRACGMTDDEALRTVTLYCSHEALALEYDRALTRVAGGRAYGLSGHFLWVGERTRQLDGAHIDFISRIANPIGVKLGPTTTPEHGDRAVREAQPGQHPGPAHPDQPDGQPQGPRRAAADRGEGDRRRRTRWSGSATRCTATPTSRPTATRPATSTGSSTRCSATSRCTGSLRHPPGRAARRADRRGRHRVPRRRAGASRTPTCRAATRPPATRG